MAAAGQGRGFGEFKLGWTVVAACLVGIACGSNGLTFYTLGHFVKPIAGEFGWDRVLIQSGHTLNLVAQLAMAPLVGLLIDRFGVRPVAMLSLAGVSLGLFLIGTITTSPLTYLVGWAVIATLGAGTTPVTWGRAVSSWFDQRRGLALGIALSGAGFVALLAPVLVDRSIAAHGWRTTYQLMALLPLLLALPLAFAFLREGPLASSSAAPRDVPGLTPAEAMRTRAFWLQGAAFFLGSIAITGIIPNLVPIMSDGGIDGAAAARVASLIGLAVLVSRLLIGYIVDHFWAPGVSALCFLLALGGCLVLLGGQPTVLTASLAAILVGFVAGAEFDLIAYLTARFCGMRHYGKLYGWQFAAFAGGAALGPILFGLTFDRTGGYDAALLGGAAMLLIAALLLLAMGRPPAAFAPRTD